MNASREIAEWERDNLTATGHYHGDQPFDGYRFGDYVPVDARYSAMMAHRWVMRSVVRRVVARGIANGDPVVVGIDAPAPRATEGS